MIIQKQKCRILNSDKAIDQLKLIEYAGRNCYASHDKITDNSYAAFITSLIKRGHESPLEFADLCFEITTSRAVLAEITRHRLASFCVESQRYIQEAKTGSITFIEPTWDEETKSRLYNQWMQQTQQIENTYIKMIETGAKSQEAREVLSNSTACKIIMKANVREWRHFFNLRCSKAAYPQMRELAKMMLTQANEIMNPVFNDLAERLLTQD